MGAGASKVFPHPDFQRRPILAPAKDLIYVMCRGDRLGRFVRSRGMERDGRALILLVMSRDPG
jgi:hypothetical protein